MTFNNLPLITWGQSSPPSVSCRIKRQADGLIYDTADKTFKAEVQVKSPWIVLNLSTSPALPNAVEGAVPLDPTQFTNGDYTVYFHDTSLPIKKLINVTSVYVQDGSCITPYTYSMTQIAGRVLDSTVTSHKVAGSIGAWMQDTTARLQAIQNKLGI